MGLRGSEQSEQTNSLSRLLSPTAGAFLWIMATWKTNVLQVSAVVCGRGQSSALLPPRGRGSLAMGSSLLRPRVGP